MSDLRDIPAVRKLAEERARAHHEAMRRRDHSLPPWDALPEHHARMSTAWALVARDPDPCAMRVDVDLDILCDMTEPASRDAFRDLIATACDIPHEQGTHLGRYTCGEHCCDGDTGRMVPCSRPVWSLMGDDGIDPVLFADCPDADEWESWTRIHVPGISAVTDPAEAIRLIALAVLGGDRG